jgi:hypothetical protein
LIVIEKRTWFTGSALTSETNGTFDVDDAWREKEGRVGVFGLLPSDCLSGTELRLEGSSTLIRCVVGGRYAIEGVELSGRW